MPGTYWGGTFWGGSYWGGTYWGQGIRTPYPHYYYQHL